MATVRPSIQPSSLSRFENAAIHWLATDDELAPRKPMMGRFRACWARAAIGQATAEPTTLMKSRRLIVAPEAQRRNGSNWRRCSGRAALRKIDVRKGSIAGIGATGPRSTGQPDEC